MFDSIGWLEIFAIIIIGLIVIGPERLPGVIEDIRAAIFAARRAINNAKAELNGDFGDDFEEFKKPLNTVSEYAALGPKRAVAKVLFDEDEQFLDQFDPKKMLEEDPAAPASPKQTTQKPAEQPEDKGDFSIGGGFSWADIT
ncbi:Sec-independent protein translocase TatB [Corynebacterium breve]|uniref:Sec-independent protein translocase protein TatB n=1 Tax=Corynebacterium breve TaxID=3049799 RepID=A0ABY8VG00_9CORY|nr:Sec-independent protein translocase TatB [Corynebacterium breve]WIM68574.1 Sec-independent protein translocase TatB [Corynebacterium breve]